MVASSYPLLQFQLSKQNREHYLILNITMHSLVDYKKKKINMITYPVLLHLPSVLVPGKQKESGFQITFINTHAHKYMSISYYIRTLTCSLLFNSASLAWSSFSLAFIS
jgi:hypothetical protein